jgi:hypothetical protein
MTCGALIAAFMANKELLLVLWLVLEQWLASTKKIKANSSLQLLVNLINASLKQNKNSNQSQTGR